MWHLFVLGFVWLWLAGGMNGCLVGHGFMVEEVGMEVELGHGSKEVGNRVGRRCWQKWQAARGTKGG